MISNLEANIELVNLAKSITCLDEFTKQFNILVSSGCLTNVFSATIYTIVNLDNNNDEKCIIISDKFNECYIMYLNIHSVGYNNIFKHISNKNIKQDVLHALLVNYMFNYYSVYPTKFINAIDLDKLYLMFIECYYFTISHKYEQIYLHFKNNKVYIDKYNDIIVDNIIRMGNERSVNLDIFNFTSEQLDKLNLYGCLNTIDTLHQTMIDNEFDYDVVKHIFDTNPDYTPNRSIYNDVMDHYYGIDYYGIHVDKIFELLMSRGCYPKYINIVKYVVEHRVDISLETFNNKDLDDHKINYCLKYLINNVDINPYDKKIYIPKYRNNIVLPVGRYFDDDIYVNVNIFLASIVDNVNKNMKIKDIKNIIKRKNSGRDYIKSKLKYIHIDDVPNNKNIHIHIDNFIDYVLDKYLP